MHNDDYPYRAPLEEGRQSRLWPLMLDTAKLLLVAFLVLAALFLLLLPFLLPRVN